MTLPAVHSGDGWAYSTKLAAADVLPACAACLRCSAYPPRPIGRSRKPHLNYAFVAAPLPVNTQPCTRRSLAPADADVATRSSQRQPALVSRMRRHSPPSRAPLRAAVGAYSEGTYAAVGCWHWLVARSRSVGSRKSPGQLDQPLSDLGAPRPSAAVLAAFRNTTGFCVCVLWGGGADIDSRLNLRGASWLR